MKIKADHVTYSCDYLTAGKVYDVIEENTDDLGKQFFIYDDRNDYIEILLSNCYHLGRFSWQIIEDYLDISKHEFSDTTITETKNNGDYLHIKMDRGYNEFTIDKTDAIVIAKALGVKGSDL